MNTPELSEQQQIRREKWQKFLAAMEQGMSPTARCGMGVDRLLMALTGLGIRETVLFPMVKQEA